MTVYKLPINARAIRKAEISELIGRTEAYWPRYLLEKLRPQLADQGLKKGHQIVLKIIDGDSRLGSLSITFTASFDGKQLAMVKTSQPAEWRLPCLPYEDLMHHL